MTSPLTQSQTFWFIKDWRSQRRSEPSRTSKMELLASSILDVWVGSEYISVSFFPTIFYVLLGKLSFAGKKLGEPRNEFLQMVDETSPNKLLLFPKSLYTIPLNRENKWLKFLFASLVKAKK